MTLKVFSCLFNLFERLHSADVIDKTFSSNSEQKNDVEPYSVQKNNTEE